MFRLYLITDPAIGDIVGAVERALAAIPTGAAAVQLRDRAASGRALHETALRLREATARWGAPLLVNDRADIAIAAGADGVHLRENSIGAHDARALGLRLVARSTHATGGGVAAGADFAVFGPVFATPGKSAPVGLQALAAACATAGDLPVFALGGVSATRARDCRAAGAHGVACINGVLGAPDPAAAAHAMWEAVTSC
ncbi:MAG: thiamine phosphate synthase [Myxococcota bacterium]